MECREHGGKCELEYVVGHNLILCRVSSTEEFVEIDQTLARKFSCLCLELSRNLSILLKHDQLCNVVPFCLRELECITHLY
jgi:hypothetical protein